MPLQFNFVRPTNNEPTDLKSSAAGMMAHMQRSFKKMVFSLSHYNRHLDPQVEGISHFQTHPHVIRLVVYPIISDVISAVASP
jgi:hypothetical protein